MNRISFAALFAIAAMALTGCSGSTTPPTDSSSTASASSEPPKETTVLINGKEWTCQEFAQPSSEDCNELIQQTFDTYKENIDTYVTSGRLGALKETNGFAYADVGFAGLVACGYMVDGKNFIDFVRDLTESPRYSSRLTLAGMYNPAWNEAPQSLCPGVKLPNQNPGSSRIP